MESRSKEIIKTSIVIGGNVGNLGAAAGFMLSSVWDWGGGICRQLIPDFMAANLNLAANYTAYVTHFANHYTEVLSQHKDAYFPPMRAVLKPSGLDVFGISGVFERSLEQAVKELTQGTIVFFNDHTQSSLMATCTHMLGPKYLIPIGYVAGAALGFTVAAAYQYLQGDGEATPAPIATVIAPAPQLSSAGNSLRSAANSLKRASSLLSYSATLFSNLPSEERKNSDTLIALRDTFGRSRNLKPLLVECEQSRLSPAK